LISRLEMSNNSSRNLSIEANDAQSESSDAEMVDNADAPSFVEPNMDVSMKSKSSHRSGRRPLPLMWTRVISVEEIGAAEHEVFEIAEDKHVEYQQLRGLPKGSKVNWKPFFDPKAFWEQQADRRIESFKISNRNLKSIGKKVTDLRSIIVDRAEKYSQQIPDALEEGLEEAR